MRPSFRLTAVFFIGCGIASVSLLRSAVQAQSDDPVSSSPVVKKLPAPREFDIACETAEKVFETEIQSADKVYMLARRKAAEKRLATYKLRLTDFTKAGDFDRAVSIREQVDAMENSPDDAIRPKPKTVKFEGHEYALIKEPATWHVAKRRCEEMGGYLAVLNSVNEDRFIANLVGNENASRIVGGQNGGDVP